MENGMHEGAVTLLDVLGWKGIWQREQEADVLLNDLIDRAKERLKRFTTDGRGKNQFKEITWDIISISDTIVFTAVGECNAAIKLTALFNNVNISNFLTAGLPLRGATSYGYYSVKNNILVGPAIDEVASWYEQADWIGVHMTPSATFRCEANTMVGYWEDYEIPSKTYGKINSLCFNWPMAWIIKKSKDELMQTFLKMAPITPDIAIKINNTLKFFDEMMKNEKVIGKIKAYQEAKVTKKKK